jgi:hypothetical protein
MSSDNFATLFFGEHLNFTAEHASLFNFFWSVEKHDANPANTGTIGLVESVKSVLICG